MDIPLGIAYISSFLKSVNHTVELIDLSNEKDYLSKIPDADIYGISVTTPQFSYFKRVVNYIKQNTNALIVSGGPHSSSRPKECLEAKVDIAVIGEGEEIMLNIIRNRGYNGYTGIIKDLDSLPFPDRSNNNYRRTIQGKKAHHIITARGCPYTCSFCSKKSVGTNTRFRSLDNIMDEIESTSVNAFVIYDDTFTFKRDRAIQIARELGNRGSIWRCFSRTDKVDKQMLNIFKQNGLNSITFGIETFSQKMLNVYNKQNTVQNNIDALNICKELDIPVRCSLIYGGPFETRKTLSETIEGVKQTQPDEWNVSTFVPIPGSDIGDNPSKYKTTCHKDLDYLKYHRVGESGFGEILIDISTMSPDQYKKNRKWFVKELEKVCPRKNIQDSIQTLRI